MTSLKIHYHLILAIEDYIMIIPTPVKNKTLDDLAGLIAEHAAGILEQNKKDLDNAGELDPTLVDRLRADEKKIKGMIAAIREVISLDDPEARVISQYQHPNGMFVENRTVPFGRILIIYESRPDVTIEAAINAFKAGNSILLKGGKESRNTNLFLVDLWRQALTKNQLPADLVTYLDIGREETQKMLRDNTYHLDLIIPRGGEALIEYIRQNTSVPLIISGRGNNFVYVHTDADMDMTQHIVINGKSRLSVCNAIDKVLFNAAIPGLEQKMERLVEQALTANLEVYGDGNVFNAFPSVRKMEDPSMYDEEFLSPKILFGTVASAEEAIRMINTHSGKHSAVIITMDRAVAQTFQQEVDCAAVYHNASSRFTDGGQFGMGAEIAISTQKLHFRGPVGLGQLVTNKFFVSGNGQVRN